MLEKVVVDALLKEKIQDIEEFRFFFDSKTKVEKWISKISLGDDANIQAARVRRAWHAVTMYYKTFEQDRSKVATTDLDTLLDDSELRTFKQNFLGQVQNEVPNRAVSRECLGNWTSACFALCQCGRSKACNGIDPHKQETQAGRWTVHRGT